MAKYTTLTSLFTAIADAIRAKGSGSGKIVADDFPEMIGRISTGITPTGTKTITANGTHDVTNYAAANVNVPASGITPSGSINITENGTYDVTNYASAVVNVAASGGSITTEVYDVTIASGLGSPTGANSIHTLLTGNAFVKNNRDKDTFAVFMFAKTPVATATKLAHSVYHGNINIAASNVARYGFSYCGNSASAIGFSPITNKINATGYNVSFRTTTAGNLSIYVASDRTVPAGDYTLVLINWAA